MTSDGTVYLLHFDRPYKHARHYIGWTGNLDARLADHRRGTGARLLAVLKAEGIGWQLARTWDGSRARERQIKRQGGASRRCPMCGITPKGSPPCSPVTPRPARTPAPSARTRTATAATATGQAAAAAGACQPVSA